MTDSRSFDIIAYIDGGSRGNPGPAGYGVLISSSDGSPVDQLSEFIGRTTNNFAEYQGLLAALDYALEHGHPRLKIRSDSELLVRQLQGVYKVKSPDLAPLHQKARQMIAQLDAFAVEHIPRELNREADRLANLAMDRGHRAGPTVTPRRSTRTLGFAKPGLSPPKDEVLRARATYQDRSLKLEHPLPLAEGEEVQVEIRRGG